MALCVSELRGHDLTQVVLRQAEERTQLVVDCAGLVRRLEKLDAEIAEYDQWQRYPDPNYKTKVQKRFEEARAREHHELSVRGGGPRSIAGQLPLMSLDAASPSPQGAHSGRLRSPLKGNASEEDQEHRLAVAHLQHALKAADFEAEVWRSRASEMEMYSEQEREQAKRLMEFQLSVALKDAEEERALMISQLKERDAAFETLEAEYASLRQERDVFRATTLDQQRRLEESQEQHKTMANISIGKESEISSMRKELETVRYNLDVKNESAKRLEGKLLDANTDRDAQIGALETSRAQAARLGETINAREADIADLRRVIDSINLKLDGREAELKVVREERDRQNEIVVSAKRRAELLNAKCDNLEAALTNATAKQADNALERDAQRERAHQLLQDNEQLRLLLEEARGVLQDPKGKLPSAAPGVSLASTMASAMNADTSGSGEADIGGARSQSPRPSPPPLPPVRPPSGKISPKGLRDLLVQH